MSFDKMGVDRADVQNALERIKIGELGRWKTRSRTTYILCPIDHQLWDLKPVVGLIWEDSDPILRTKGWVTDTFEPDLLKRGFTVLKFKETGRRKLGIMGCDLAELGDPHTVYFPDGSHIDNGLFPEEKVMWTLDGQKRTVIASRYVRNSAYKKQILDNANNFCDACKMGSFLMANGNQYLEVHHKTWLSEGGPDIPENMVALCPNCHRQEHFGTNRRYPRCYQNK